MGCEVVTEHWAVGWRRNCRDQYDWITEQLQTTIVIHQQRVQPLPNPCKHLLKGRLESYIAYSNWLLHVSSISCRAVSTRVRKTHVTHSLSSDYPR
jgi:hypothetical protein